MARKTGLKPTAAERRAHDISSANLFPDTAGRRADLRPCRKCGTRDHGGELGPAQDANGTPVDGWCTPCAQRAWDRAAVRDMSEPESNADAPSDAAW